MKPLPNIDDTEAMLKRGRRSAFMSARNEAAEHLRDVLVAVQGTHQVHLGDAAVALRELAQRFDSLAAMEEKIK